MTIKLAVPLNCFIDKALKTNMICFLARGLHMFNFVFLILFIPEGLDDV